MKALGYEGAPVTVRDDLTEAHRAAWRQTSEAGTWFTGAERTAIAAESRNARKCALCAERKAALTPYAVDGEHETIEGTPLSSPVVDVIHRVVTDPGRLSKRWFDDTLAAGLHDAEYVEIVAVVARTVAIDTFCDALGAPRHELYEPQPGAPTRLRPTNVVDGGAWVPISAKGDANISRSLGLVPEESRGAWRVMHAHYGRDEDLRDPRYQRAITRPQMELIAARTAALAGCFY